VNAADNLESLPNKCIHWLTWKVQEGALDEDLPDLEGPGQLDPDPPNTNLNGNNGPASPENTQDHTPMKICTSTKRFAVVQEY
jgi:hypothetical protein